MIYNAYLKEKLVNLYLQKQKIGKHSITDQDFNFLNKYFDYEIKPNVYAVSELLQHIIKDYKENNSLQTKIGLDFLDNIEFQRKEANTFLKQTSLQLAQITIQQKNELEEKYTEIAIKYGLKEFYYSLDPLLTPNQNYDKAILLLNKTEIELNKLQQKLDLKEPFKIGNNILSIQINWKAEPQNQGYYNYCSNTICLKDEQSTFPLIHEYVHFIDKTTTCLFLTGKTSQQLYEEKIFSQKELFHNFDMSVFSKIDFKKENFPWITTLKLKSLFKEEMNQNKYMQEVFNKFDSKKDYQQEFKDIMYDWIEDKQYPNKELLKQDIDNSLKNKTTQFNFGNSYSSSEEKELINKTLLFNTFNNKQNNIKNWSEELDVIKRKIYYTTQKEMLARTIEQATQGKLQQLSDRLTTPILSNHEKNNFYEIIKSWQNTSQEILSYQNKQNASNRIINIRKQLEKQPEIISQFKLKS